MEVEYPDCDGIGCAGFDEDDEGRFWPAGTYAACGGEGMIPSPAAAPAPEFPLDGVRCVGRGYHTKSSVTFTG